MKFQFQSDIHLEVGDQYNTYEIHPVAPYLILAGDIGNLAQYSKYLSFVQRQCANFDKVFLVLGNHEFYNNARAEGVSLAQQLTVEEGCKDKLILLHRTQHDLDIDIDIDADSSAGTKEKVERVTILGCTLNSRISEANALMTRMKVHDFNKIKDWTVETHNEEHGKDVAWLRGRLADLASSDRKVLVVTHHAPFRHGCIKPEYETNEWHDAFATDLLETDELLRNADSWIFGHTHYTTDCVVGGVRCIANQRGYVFPWQIQTGSDAKTDTDQENDKDTGKVEPVSLSRMTRLLKRLKGEKEKGTFKVNYPGPMKGHEGDGLIPFDPLRCLDI